MSEEATVHGASVPVRNLWAVISLWRKCVVVVMAKTARVVLVVCQFNADAPHDQLILPEDISDFGALPPGADCIWTPRDPT